MPTVVIVRLEYAKGCIETLIREAGLSARTYKSALFFVFVDDDAALREDARKLLAWEDIRDEDTRFDEEQAKQLNINLQKAERDLKETIWRSYKKLAFLDRDNQIVFFDLGLITSSSATSPVKYILNRLRNEDIVTDSVSPNFLVRNWSVAFPEWSTKSIHDAFFASPVFPRLLSSNAVKEAIARGVKEGKFAYCGQGANNQYEPFIFQKSLSPQDIEISDSIFLIQQKEAELYQEKITKPPVLSKLVISQAPTSLKPNEECRVVIKGEDQYGGNIAINNINWKVTGAEITNNILKAGETTGSYLLEAEVEGITTKIPFNIQEVNNPPSTPIIQPTKNQLTWRSKVPPQKWSQLYMKVLTKFATNEFIQTDIEVRVSIKGEISEQLEQEIANSLQELGLEKLDSRSD